MTLPNFTQAHSSLKEGSISETDVVPQLGAVSARSLAVDERRTQVAEVTAEREPVPDSPEKNLEERKLALEHREREVESWEKELEKRKLAIDDIERKVQVETQMKIEGVERRERELEKRLEEFEKEKENWPNILEWKASIKGWFDDNLALLPA